MAVAALPPDNIDGSEAHGSSSTSTAQDHATTVLDGSSAMEVRNYWTVLKLILSWHASICISFESN